MWKAPSILTAIVLVLVALGIVMLASSSSVKAGDQFNDPEHFLKRQVAWLVIAVVAILLSAFVVDYHWFRKWPIALLLFVSAVVLLCLVFVPGVGCRVGGASRWIRIGSFRVGQPSEIAKFAVIVTLASWMSHVGYRAARLKEGLILPLIPLGLIAGLIFIEPDYGTTILVAAVGMAVMFVGGTRFAHLIVTGTLGLACFLLAIMQNPERVRRFMAFLNPASFPDEAYQLSQSVNAFVMGGGWGVGLGRSLQKHSYLPEAHTDFILAIIGEELGVAATVTVVLLFAGFLICGVIISMRAKDMFGRLLGFGITAMVSLQAAMNIGVVTGCLPTKGLPLPFISSGGSSLVVSMFCVGVLLNIARHSSGTVADKHTRTIKDGLHSV